jgi:hypothetical protein
MGKPSVDVVFRSGLGPRQEQVLPAELAAADMAGDYGNDLAFLAVRGVTNAPLPIDTSVRAEPTEGTPYLGAGFPLGGKLNEISDTKGNPSVTITGGRIASLKRDEYGHINLLQVDGSLQPGNSGGPIVDEKTGKLIGVAVASLARAGIDTIGFIIPVEEVRRALAGRVGAVDLTLQASAAGTASLLVKAQVVDPKQIVKGILVHAAPASAVGTLQPNVDGSWPALPASMPVELQRDPKSASATGYVQITLSGKGPDARKVILQTARRDQAGRLVYFKPKEYNLPEKPGRLVKPDALQQAIAVATKRSMALLGPLIDPDKDCQLIKDEANSKMQIAVPGKLHTLSPEITSLKGKRLPLHNAPMALTDAEGDFLLAVLVSGDIKPGTSPPANKQVKALPFTVQSAGLVVYEDRNNFLRFERAGSIFSDSLTSVHRLIIEAVKDGKQAMRPIYLDIPVAPTFLIVARKNGQFQCQFSTDGTARSIRSFREIALDLPTKLKVGITAANVSAKAFNASFESFVFLTAEELEKGPRED